MALAPRTVQNMPDCLRRLAITVLQALDHTGAHKKVAATERGIAHTFAIAFEIIRLGLKQVSGFRVGSGKGTQLLDERFDFSFVEFVLKFAGPTLLLGRIGREQLAGENPEVLTGMVKIDDLNGAWKLAVGDVPDPYGSVAEDDPDLCMVPASVQRFGVHSSGRSFRPVQWLRYK